MLIGALIFLSLLIAILAIPVVLDFQLHWQREFYTELQLSWMFGLVRVKKLSGQHRSVRATSEKTTNETSRPRTDIKKRNSAIRLILDPQLRHRIVKYLRDLWLSVEKEDVRLRIRAGFDNPADTGQLWGLVGPLAGTLASVKDASINVEPDFLNAGFILGSRGILRFNPLTIILLSIGLLLSPSVWRGLRQIGAGR